MGLTVRRHVDAAIDYQEEVALAFALELGAEFLEVDLRSSRMALRDIAAIAVVGLHLELQQLITG